MFSRKGATLFDELIRPSSAHILYSRSVENIVGNNNFDDTTDWTVSGANISATSNELTMTATAQYGRGVYSISADGSGYGEHVIMFGAWVKATDTDIAVAINDGVSQKLVYPTVTDEYQFIYGTHTVNDSPTHVQFILYDRGVAPFNAQKMKKVFAVDATAEFGAGNEPSEADFIAWLKRQPNSWFDNDTTCALKPLQWF